VSLTSVSILVSLFLVIVDLVQKRKKLNTNWWWSDLNWITMDKTARKPVGAAAAARLKKAGAVGVSPKPQVYRFNSTLNICSCVTITIAPCHFLEIVASYISEVECCQCSVSYFSSCYTSAHRVGCCRQGSIERRRRVSRQVMHGMEQGWKGRWTRHEIDGEIFGRGEGNHHLHEPKNLYYTIISKSNSVF